MTGSARMNREEQTAVPVHNEVDDVEKLRNQIFQEIQLIHNEMSLRLAYQYLLHLRK